jgi:hypothetical protein
MQKKNPGTTHKDAGKDPVTTNKAGGEESRGIK